MTEAFQRCRTVNAVKIALPSNALAIAFRL